jgi:hypothetical protein
MYFYPILTFTIGFCIAYLKLPYLLDWVVTKSRKRGFYNGPWKTHLGIAKPETGLIEKAAITRVGLGASHAQETVYWNAFTDSEGNDLNTAYTYKILIITEIPVRKDEHGFWSITAYGADQFLMKTIENIYLVRDEDVLDKQYPISIVLSATPPIDGCLYIPLTSKKQKFTLALRCYRPSDSMKAYETCKQLQLPTINRI